MFIVATTRTGCALSRSKLTSSALKNGGIAFRLDRPGFRPLRFRCPTGQSSNALASRSFSSLSTARRVSKAFSVSPSTFARGLATVPPEDQKPKAPESSSNENETEEITESPYTIPNALTLARIIACPFLGYQIVQGEWATATTLLVACGVSDWLDGYLARRWGGKSVLGSILDPAADKLLMTTLVVTLSIAGKIPVALAVLIIGRDVALSISAFYFRYISLPPPRTFKRYWDFSIPSAEVKPTQISKYNTFLQLLLMGGTTISPLIPYATDLPLEILQWVVAGTTIWSGLSYVAGAGVRILPRGIAKKP